MNATKLSCPKCRRVVPEAFWQGVDVVRCQYCENEFEQLRFPALAASHRVDRASSLASGEANCYFHAENRAEAACDGCGRFVCAVCRLPFSGAQYCPSCLEARSDRRKLPENHRVLYSHMAILLALVPLIMWPLTLLSAPAALALCFYGWNKPGSLVTGRGRGRFVVAGILAGIQVCAWTIGIGALILR